MSVPTERCSVEGDPLPALPSGCRWRRGGPGDRSALLACVRAAFAEAFPQQVSWEHLVDTVDRHFDPQRAPLWWIETAGEVSSSASVPQRIGRQNVVGCVWACRGIGQATGAPVAYILTLWVEPSWRRRGLGSALVRAVDAWAVELEFDSVELQVFGQNVAARALYERLGFKVEGLWLARSIEGLS